MRPRAINWANWQLEITTDLTPEEHEASEMFALDLWAASQVAFEQLPDEPEPDLITAGVRRWGRGAGLLRVTREAAERVERRYATHAARAEAWAASIGSKAASIIVRTSASSSGPVAVAMAKDTSNLRSIASTMRVRRAVSRCSQAVISRSASASSKRCVISTRARSRRSVARSRHITLASPARGSHSK